DMQVAAELGVQPAPLHEDLPRSVQLQIEADHELALWRRRRLTGATHIEYGDLRGKGIRAAGDRTFQVDHAREVETLAQRSLELDVTVQVGRQNVARDGLGIPGRQMQAEWQLWLRDGDLTGD